MQSILRVRTRRSQMLSGQTAKFLLCSLTPACCLRSHVDHQCAALYMQRNEKEEHDATGHTQSAIDTHVYHKCRVGWQPPHARIWGADPLPKRQIGRKA